MDVIKTVSVGNNADLILQVSKMYLNKGDIVADVTYGKGAFWRNVDLDDYDFRPTDLMDGIDFANLPYEDNSIDVVVFDPPYMHGGVTIKKSINKCYRNQNTSHSSVFRLYAAGILEAARVLKKKGLLWVKTQDEIESGKQRFTHNEIMSMMEMSGFLIVDLFVLVQSTIPAMREQYQKSARKNHSYLLVGRFRR